MKRYSIQIDDKVGKQFKKYISKNPEYTAKGLIEKLIKQFLDKQK